MNPDQIEMLLGERAHSRTPLTLYNTIEGCLALLSFDFRGYSNRSEPNSHCQTLEFRTYPNLSEPIRTHPNPSEPTPPPPQISEPIRT
jgi:hypothetical protein